MWLRRVYPAVCHKYLISAVWILFLSHFSLSFLLSNGLIWLVTSSLLGLNHFPNLLLFSHVLCFSPKVRGHVLHAYKTSAGLLKNVCACMHAYVLVCVRAFVRSCVHAHACVYIYMYMYIYVCVYIYGRMYGHMCLCMCMRVHTCVQVYAH
jgi:hypothetical protein